MYSAIRHFCFTPESGHVQCKRSCPLSANSGLMRGGSEQADFRADLLFPGKRCVTTHNLEPLVALLKCTE
jgi:hypothetical protein